MKVDEAIEMTGECLTTLEDLEDALRDFGGAIERLEKSVERLRRSCEGLREAVETMVGNRLMRSV